MAHATWLYPVTPHTLTAAGVPVEVAVQVWEALKTAAGPTTAVNVVTDTNTVTVTVNDAHQTLQIRCDPNRKVVLVGDRGLGVDDTTLTAALVRERIVMFLAGFDATTRPDAPLSDDRTDRVLQRWVGRACGVLRMTPEPDPHDPDAPPMWVIRDRSGRYAEVSVWNGWARTGDDAHIVQDPAVGFDLVVWDVVRVVGDLAHHFGVDATVQMRDPHLLEPVLSDTVQWWSARVEGPLLQQIREVGDLLGMGPLQVVERAVDEFHRTTLHPGG